MVVTCPDEQKTNVDDRVNGQQWGGRLNSFAANYKFSSDFSAGDRNSTHRCEAWGGSSSPDACAGAETEVKFDVSELLPGSHTHDKNSKHSLAALVKDSKEKFGLKHFLVWHTLSGYWAGVQPSEAPGDAARPCVSEGDNKVEGENSHLHLCLPIFRALCHRGVAVASHKRKLLAIVRLLLHHQQSVPMFLCSMTYQICTHSEAR